MTRLETETDFRRNLLLSVQRALLGRVGPDLRRVTLDWNWNKRQSSITAIFDGPVSERDQEDMEIAHTEVISDFPEVPNELKLDLRIMRIDTPEPVKGFGKVAVFERRE